MAASAQYVATPKIGSANLNTAEANFTTSFAAPANAAAVFTAGANGSRIDQINLAGNGITVASMVRLYIYDGANYSFLKDVPVTAVTPSTTTAAYNASLCTEYNPELFPILLPTGYSLRATVSTAQTGSGIRVTALGGDL